MGILNPFAILFGTQPIASKVYSKGRVKPVDYIIRFERLCERGIFKLQDKIVTSNFQKEFMG